VSDGVNSATASAQDSAGYNGATAAISVVKQVSVDGGATWYNEGVGAPTIAEGLSVEFRVQVTNNSTYGLAATDVSVSDTGSYTGAFTFNSGASTSVSLAAGASATSDAVTITAQLGTNADTANAIGTVTDGYGNSAHPTATDNATYTGAFVEKTAGLSKGYWYNHNLNQAAYPNHHWATEAYVAGYGYGVLLGDSTGSDWKLPAATLTVSYIKAHNELFIPDAAAYQLINSSQSANDARQILMSQAISAQLNINNGDIDPGAGTTGDLIKYAVDWLEGSSGGYGGPYSGFTDKSSGNVDKSHDGVLGSDDYSTTAKAFTFEGADGYVVANKALSSSTKAWQALETFTPQPAGVHFITPNLAAPATVQADGEGLKNALMAFNQNQLVTDAYGHVAWDQSGSTSGPFTYAIANGADDFWAVLNAAIHDPLGLLGSTSNSSLFHGIL
jgi:hypothetical protein